MKSTLSIFTFLVLILFADKKLSAQQHQLIKQWETDSVLKVPESVLYDKANKVLYASNIDGDPAAVDGKGSIAKVGLDGKIISVEWVSGLNSPKGLGLYKNTLWVADIDHVVSIDVPSGKITNRIKIEGALFLNDVTIDKKGIVYVSDSRTKKVHRVEKDKPTLFLENLQGPNGLLAKDGQLLVLDNGGLYKVGTDKKPVKLVDGMEGGTDGVEHVQGNEYVVSCWGGVIYYVNTDGSRQMLLDTRDQKINSADIGYDAVNRIVYVPTFYKNSVVAYQLK